MRRLAIDVRPGEYAIVRLGPRDALPEGLLDPVDDTLVSVTRTGDETSVVCPAELVPGTARSEHGWRLLTVRGPLAFSLTGIIAALSSELAAAGVALFSLSTFDTDHLLVKAAALRRAITVLRAAGHEIHGV